MIGSEPNEAVQEAFPDHLDQPPPFDPAEPEPIPENDFEMPVLSFPPSAPEVPPGSNPYPIRRGKAP
jgi:hypothetical protein